MKKFLLISLTLLSLGASARSLETLMGYTFNQTGITFQVATGGCTNRKDFVLDIKESGGIYHIAVFRTKPDYCLAFFRYGTKVTYSYDELGIEPYERFQLLNPIDASYRGGE